MGIWKIGSRLGPEFTKGHIYSYEQEQTHLQARHRQWRKARARTGGMPKTFVTPPQLKAETKGTSDEEEIGGYDGPDPTRFGDWEHKGRVTDF